MARREASPERQDMSDSDEEMICPKHDEPLDYFCQTDQQSMCFLCLIADHSNHKTVVKEWTGKEQNKETYKGLEPLVDFPYMAHTLAENLDTSDTDVLFREGEIRRSFGLQYLRKLKLASKERLSICDSGASALDLHCQSCVDVADSDQWVQVEPFVCRDEGGSEFRISTPAGRYECSRTRMRWVCDEDVILYYQAVDGRCLNAELERLQCERVAPVLDVNVISGKLEEAHLPHYMCLAESDPALTNAVKLLSVEDEGISLESVELTRFHAKILQPTFSPKTVLVKLGIAVKVHCDLLIFMTQTSPIILHVYFFPSNKLVKKNIKTEEKSSHQIKCSRPEAPLQMRKQHSLEVPGAVVQPKTIKLRGDDEPNFFQVKQPVVKDITMTLSRADDQEAIWTGTIWKELIDVKQKFLFRQLYENKTESDLFQCGQKHKTQQPACSFDKAQFFDTHWCNLIKSVKNVNAVADKLLQEQIIHEELYSEITHPNSTNEESMRRICVIVRKGSDTVKEIFISILLQENPNLLNHLPSPDS